MFPPFLSQNISFPLSATLFDEYCLWNMTESPLGNECPRLSRPFRFFPFLPKRDVLLSLFRISAADDASCRASSSSISLVPFSDASNRASSYANLCAIEL